MILKNSIIFVIVILFITVLCYLQYILITNSLSKECLLLLNEKQILYYLKIIYEDLPKYLQTIFYTTAIGTFLLATIQFKYNTEWNKKQLTIKMLYKLKDELKVHFEFLHETFKYRDLKKPIEISVIHKKMGIFLEEKNKNKYKKEDIINISNNEFVYQENGKEINNNIKNFLNDLEAFSAAVNDNTFDEKQSKTLMKAIITRAYKYFKPYIMHLRKDHKEISDTAYKELFTLGEKWSK